MAGEVSVTTNLRVRYADTDKMGIVYYANYLVYFEVGRTEFIRKLWKSYSEIEKAGYILPVLSSGVEYKASAFYDDMLEVKTILENHSGARIKFRYEIRREGGALLAVGFTEHCFAAPEGRPRKMPAELRNRLRELLEAV